jgi:hypothetical protein
MDSIERKKIIERRNLHNNKTCTRCKKVYYPAYRHFYQVGTNPSGSFKLKTVCNQCMKREEELIMKWV